MRKYFRVNSFSVAAAAVATLVLVPAQANAQANITATANVATALSVTAGNNLDFGLVIPGFTKTVAVADATAGTFSLGGGAGAEVDFSFTLPANLVNGVNNLPINTWTGSHNTANDPTAGATTFTPSGASVITVLSGTGQLFIFVGARVDATASPPNGTYNGTVTLTAAYTGN